MQNRAAVVPRIFLAEDDEEDIEFFKEALTEIDPSAELLHAYDGIELLAALEKNTPPFPLVIFLDLNMPKKNGIECLREIRGNYKHKDIPVVIFSTTDQNETVNLTYLHGANYYIKKPNSFAHLRDCIARVLGIDWQNSNGQPLRAQYLLSC